MQVEHIGSTAVPGLAAKPVIDSLPGAPSLGAVEARIDALSTCGYRYVPEHERELPARRYFVRTAELRVHLHGVELGSPLRRDRLAFRAALRADAELRDRYAALKLRLAQAHAQDKSAYTVAKGPFIGLFLAARTESALRIGFDADSIEGFHVYDLCVSERAHRAGLRLRIRSDLRVRWREIGPFPVGDQDQAPRFRARLAQARTRPEHAPGSVFPAELNDRAAMRASYGWLQARLADRGPRQNAQCAIKSCARSFHFGAANPASGRRVF